MVIHRRLRLASYRRADTGETRRASSRKHVLRTTGPYVYTSSLSPRPPRLLLLVSTQFLLRLRSAASVWQDWQVARSFRSAQFSRFELLENERGVRKRNREKGIAAGPSADYKRRRIRQIQLTRTELNRRNPSAGNSFSLLPLTRSLFRSSLSDYFLRSPFPPPTEHLGGYPSRNSTKISEEDKRHSLPWNSSFNFYGGTYTRAKEKLSGFYGT